jgi:hypothetical protein
MTTPPRATTLTSPRRLALFRCNGAAAELDQDAKATTATDGATRKDIAVRGLQFLVHDKADRRRGVPLQGTVTR